MIYGTPEEKKTIIDWVHKAHSVVKGPDYTADDPDLQLWVKSALPANSSMDEILTSRFTGRCDTLCWSHGDLPDILRQARQCFPEPSVSRILHYRHIASCTGAHVAKGQGCF